MLFSPTLFSYLLVGGLSRLRNYKTKENHNWPVKKAVSKEAKTCIAAESSMSDAEKENWRVRAHASKERRLC